MRYKHLERANIDISELAIGTWGIGGNFDAVKENDSVDAIHTELDNGVTLIDTAPVYGNGKAELIVGKAIKGLDRSKFMISSKFDVGMTTVKAVRTGDGSGRDGSFANVMYECEQSLRRLGTDYIDFYFVHWPDYDTPFEETMDALNTLKKQGKIRFIGVSNFSIEQMEECEKYARIDVIQPPYSMVVRRDEGIMKWAMEKGIGTFTYGSLGAGILSGRFRTVPTFEKTDVRNGFYPFFKEPNFSKVMKVLQVMDQISEKEGKPLSQIALNWVAQKEFVSTTLCGASKPKHAKENCDAFSWKLSDEEMSTLNQAVEKYIDFDGAAPIK